MQTRGSHNPKTLGQRQAYNRYIQRLDYDPTVDDALRFSNSTQPGEELSEPTSNRKRSLNTSERLIDHFRENWLNWLVGLFLLVFLWLMVDSKIDLARINVILNIQGHNIDKNEDGNQKNSEKNVAQDLIISEYKFRIEALEKKVDRQQPISKISADSK